MMSKKMFAGAMTLAAAAAVMFAANVDTEAASRRIYIDGSRTAWVGRTIELDADGAFDDDYAHTYTTHTRPKKTCMQFFAMAGKSWKPISRQPSAGSTKFHLTKMHAGA